jgi:hypothetical protein
MHPRQRSRNASVPRVAACWRSEGSDGHTPLPKRGPHLRKRTPLAAAARAGRSPGAACVSVHSGPEVAASSTTAPSSPQPPRTSAEPTPTEPIEPPPTPDPAFRLPSLLPTPARPTPPPSASPRWPHPPLSRHTSTHTSHAAPPRCRRPAPAHQHPPELARPGLPGGSRKGGQRNAVAPLPRKPRRERENAPGRGGGPFALKANP